MTPDPDDPSEQERVWLLEQRRNIQRYLDDQGVPHAGVSFQPAWHVAPYVSVWIVRSASTRGAVGWWAISGDYPTDYLNGGDAPDALRAMTGFARRWREVARYMLRGEEHPTMKLGRPHQRRQLGALLMRQAESLQSLVSVDFPED